MRGGKGMILAHETNPERPYGKQAGARPGTRRAAEENALFFTQISDPDTEEILLRINYGCNQRCVFCWVEQGYRDLPRDEMLNRIREIGRRRIPAVAVTGGEPTLNPHLCEYIRLLKESHAGHVCLQTNGVLLDNPALVRDLAQARLDSAFVSLHSHNAEISDSITRAPGSFEKTVRGITNLREAGVFVVLSHVIHSRNYENLCDYVSSCRDAFGATPIIFLYAAPIYGALMSRDLIPEMSRVAPELEKALNLCLEMKTPYAGLSAMCGIPPCIFKGNLRFYPDIRAVRPGADGRDMLRTDACAACSLTRHCHGIRRNYADMYGTDEFKAVTRARPVPPPLNLRSEAEFSRMFSWIQELEKD